MRENTTNFEDEIDLRDIFITLWNKKIFIISLTSIFAILSVVYSLLLPNIYTSRTTLAPVNPEETLASELGSFSSLAAITGMNLGSSKSPKTTEAIERITSFDFFSEYFLPKIKLENMMAVSKWNSNTNTIIYDDSSFDKSSDKWVEDKPSVQEAYIVYNDILTIAQDKTTQFIKLSIDHRSPLIAKEWLDIIIFNINESMRENDKRNARNAIKFLNDSAKSTNIQSLKDITSGLLENQMQILMLATSNEAYVFKVLDSPIVPEKRSSPKRSIICIIGTLLGGMFSVLLALVNHYMRENN